VRSLPSGIRWGLSGRFARTGGTSFGPCDRWSASDDPGGWTATWSTGGTAGGTQIGESGALPMQADSGGPAASHLNARIVDLGTFGVGWGAARFGKNLVRRVAVQPQSGYHQFHESERRNWLIKYNGPQEG
jgi:hypothetical protein